MRSLEIVVSEKKSFKINLDVALESQTIKFVYSEKATTIWRNISKLFLNLLLKYRIQYFLEISSFLWPSQNIWTLRTMLESYDIKEDTESVPMGKILALFVRATHLQSRGLLQMKVQEGFLQVFHCQSDSFFYQST